MKTLVSLTVLLALVAGGSSCATKSPGEEKEKTPDKEPAARDKEPAARDKDEATRPTNNETVPLSSPFTSEQVDGVLELHHATGFAVRHPGPDFQVSTSKSPNPAVKLTSYVSEATSSIFVVSVTALDDDSETEMRARLRRWGDGLHAQLQGEVIDERVQWKAGGGDAFMHVQTKDSHVRSRMLTRPYGASWVVVWVQVFSKSPDELTDVLDSLRWL